jgi:hypothetical protein
LVPLFKVQPKRWGPHEWFFEARLSNWTLYTLIDLGGKSQLRYEHRVGIRDNLYIADHIDLQAWMGLGHTKWDQIEAGEITEAARNLEEICAHFVTALPRLLEGLVPPATLVH